MKITWNTDSIKELIPEMNTLLSNFNCEVEVDRYGFSRNCMDRSGARVSWNVLEANSASLWLLSVSTGWGISGVLRDGG